ncbi:hypothetical protein ASPZODRAFT_158060 [Penicilliopsis zonata CBS 506.65]|uniref:FAD-binding domain-containing protein n=1 Tax=Penicilliopsis zonata CBS 506.65 TaxID=1073090 RepID=A0A1L9SMI1_9EURO|nr:hypothetical protein ASPZODRAFT_158060 [Penicilliopsis zonata CBS 506.65]OJJ48316.1 hypothetical protein ASPZODRAFT_158060 [Penicilliopsis zonata CBS 506.65]
MGSVAEDHDRVLIIGAGAAGLLIAQILKKENILCTVFEQDATPHARPRDWNYGVYWAQSNLSECLPPELINQLETCQVDLHKPADTDYLPSFNGETGERILAFPAPYSLRLKRRAFLELIATGVDVQWGKRLASIDTDGSIVSVTFEDGSSASGRLLIGAEGAHSRVREFLVGKEEAALNPSPVVSSISVPRLPAEVALAVKELHPRYCLILHPDGYFGWVGIHNAQGEPGEWEFLVMISWISNEDTGLSGDAILESLKEITCSFAEPFRSVFQSLPEGTKVWHSRLSYWETQPWDNRNGTVTVVGDAAHPMTFHRGQGLNNAILDAAFLGREIAKLENKSPGSLYPAVTAYEKEVWVRGKEAVAQSNLNSMLLHNWSQLKESPLFQLGLKQKPKAAQNNSSR